MNSPIKKRTKDFKRHLTKEDIQIANKYTKICSKSYVIREMKVKTMRDHHMLIRTAKIQKTDNIKCWWVFRATGTLIHCYWECKIVQPLGKKIWWFLITLTTWPSTFLGIYSKELKTYVYTENLHTDVYWSCIYNCRNLEATKYFGGWVN